MANAVQAVDDHPVLQGENRGEEEQKTELSGMKKI